MSSPKTAKTTGHPRAPAAAPDVYGGDGSLDADKVARIAQAALGWAPEERAAMLTWLESASARERIRRRYANAAELAASVDPNFVVTPAIALIAAEVEKVLTQPNHNLIVTMPPQEGKSTLCAVWTPLRAWQLNPDRKIILSTYADQLAEKHSAECRGIIEAHGAGVMDSMTGTTIEDKIGLKLAPKNRRVSSWGIEGSKGGLVAVGLGSGITGRQADCVSGDTYILTEYGHVTARWAHSEQHTKIWAYDHTTGVAGFHRVQASRRIDGRSVVTVVTKDGRVLRCTPDHRVHTRRGYVAAAELQVSDEISSVGGLGSVPSLSGAVSGHGRRHSQGSTPWAGSLLFNDLFGDRSWEQTAEEFLHRLSRSGTEISEPDLLENVPAPAFDVEASCEVLSSVWDGIPAEIVADGLLHRELCGHGAFGADDREGELAFQDRDELRELVPVHAASDPGTGSEPLRRVPAESVSAGFQTQRRADATVPADRPPHRRESGEQQSGEPDHTVFDVSRHSSQIGFDAVARVERDRHGPEPVYDFQVAGARNFFANGLLVHNCFIIDDPYKNMMEADSAAHRHKINDWMASVVVTRLSPQAPIILIQTRWHPEDLAAVVWAADQELDREHRTWHHINIPAIAEKDVPDALGRPFGEAMVSTRGRTRKEFEQIHRQVGDRVWYAMYQGMPRNPAGGLFEKAWFEPRVSPPAHPVAAVVGIDPADSGEGDETGIIGAVLAGDGTVVFTEDRSGLYTADAWARKAVELAVEMGAREIAMEGYATFATYASVLKRAYAELHRGAREDLAAGKKLTGVQTRALAPHTPFTIAKYTESGDSVARAAALRQAFELRTARVVEYKLGVFENSAADWQAGQHCPDRVAAAVIAHWRLARLGSGHTDFATPLSRGPVNAPPWLSRRIDDRSRDFPFGRR